MSKTVFISYSHLQASIVERLKQGLRAAGIMVWIDHERLTPGTINWDSAIRQGIQASDVVVYMASSDALQSQYIQGELAVAQAYHKLIIPIWVVGDLWIHAVPLWMIQTQYLDARGNDYHSVVAKLVKLVEPTPPQPRPADAPSGTQPASSESQSQTKLPVREQPMHSSYPIIRGSGMPEPTIPIQLVYILVDVSASMAGEKLQYIAQAINDFARRIGEQPEANASIRFRVITFGDTLTSGALTPPWQLPAQSFTAQQNRSLGAALTTLAETIKMDYIPGSRRPMVFLLVSGNPTDDINAGVNAINTLELSRRPRVFLVNLNAPVTLSFAKDVTLYSYDLAPVTQETVTIFFNDHLPMVIDQIRGNDEDVFIPVHESRTGRPRPSGKQRPSGPPLNSP
jgi:uncharacterized protein YegL